MCVSGSSLFTCTGSTLTKRTIKGQAFRVDWKCEVKQISSLFEAVPFQDGVLVNLITSVILVKAGSVQSEVDLPKGEVLAGLSPSGAFVLSRRMSNPVSLRSYRVSLKDKRLMLTAVGPRFTGTCAAVSDEGHIAWTTPEPPNLFLLRGKSRLVLDSGKHLRSVTLIHSWGGTRSFVLSNADKIGSVVVKGGEQNSMSYASLTESIGVSEGRIAWIARDGTMTVGVRKGKGWEYLVKLVGTRASRIDISAAIVAVDDDAQVRAWMIRIGESTNPAGLPSRQ